jgi:hypothetical protein
MYDNTVIYLIECKDESISDTYIGHTTNIDNRCRHHEYSSRSSDVKLYEFIRDHGGWSNWDMKVITKVCCKDRGEASLEEMYWYFKLKPTLNSLTPGLNYFKRSILRDSLYKTRKGVLDRIVSITRWPKVVEVE